MAVWRGGCSVCEEMAMTSGEREKMMNRYLAVFACVGMLLSSGASRAQAPEPLSIVIFGPPSLGAFLPPVIKAQKLDMCGACLEGKTAQY